MTCDCQYWDIYAVLQFDFSIILLSMVAAWNKFKCHTIRHEDNDMRQTQYPSRLHLCCRKCFWTGNTSSLQMLGKYISDQKPLTDETTQHLHQVNL